MRIEINKTNIEDVDAIIGYSDDMLNRYEDFSSIDREKALGWTHKVIHDNIQNYATIYADGHKAGYYLLTNQGENYEIHHLFMIERYRGKGIGTSIVKRLIEETDGHLQVLVFTGDIETYHFFINLGFKVKEIFHRTRYKLVYGG